MPLLARLPERPQIFFETKANLKPYEVEVLGKAGVLWIQPGIESLRYENSGIKTSVRIKPVLPFDLSDVRKTVERLCNITSGQIVVQGVGMRRPFVLRIAEIAKVYFPEKMVRWLYDLDATKERQIELVEYLKSHLRVDYKEIDDVEGRFVKK